MLARETEGKKETDIYIYGERENERKRQDKERGALDDESDWNPF